MATALITGASQGIGACIAERLAKDGYNIAINHYPSDGDKANAEKVAETCRSYGVEVALFPANVADYTQCEEMVKAVKKQFGSIDALVNNAGMMKLVGAVMLRQKHGRVVSLASVAGLYGNPGQMNYSASKAAIIGMTKTAAKELGSRGITVNAVAPGFIKTPMTDALTDEQRDKMLGLVAMGRYGQPEEIASVVSFLCSDDASYVTGQVIEISGGLMM